MKGTILAGHYRVLDELGHGAFGHTYLAKDVRLKHNNQFVIRHLKPTSQDETTWREAKKRFPLEAKTLKKLGKNHRQIPLLLDSFEEDEEFYLVQELVEGHDLEEEIKEGKQLKEATVVNIVTEILEILTFVHGENIIHRDIKPSNIMRRKRDKKLVLIDFGTVKEIVTQPSNAQNRTICIGTNGYMPDEQQFGQPKFESDLYAVGMMGISALTGVRPTKLRDPDTREIKWRNLINTNSRLADVLDKMVCRDYRDRYSSAEEALKALTMADETIITPPDQKRDRHPLVEEVSLPSKEVEEISTQDQKPKSFVYRTAAALASLLLILGGGGYYSWQKFKTPSLLTYENNEYGFDVDYPQNWVLKTVDDPFGTVARFYPNQGDVEDTLVTLEVALADSDTSLDEYNNLAISQIIQYLPEARIISSQPIELNNQPAHRVVYTGKKQNTDYISQYLQVWFQEGNEIFIMTYVAPEDKYQEFSETVEQTIIPSLVGEKVNNL